MVHTESGPHLVVCVKVVPKPEEVRVNPQTRALDRAGARSEINPPDMNAMEMALQIKDRFGGRVSVLSMGPPFAEAYLRICLAMGADHVYLLSDRSFAGADTLATTYTLASAIRKLEPVDLIFCGEESSDGATGQVPSGLAEWLGYWQITQVNHVELDPARRVVRGRRERYGGYEALEVPLPAVLSVKTGCNEPRFWDYRRKPWAFAPEKVTIWTSADLNTDTEMIGLAGSPTRVIGLEQATSRERKRVMLTGGVQEVARQLASQLREMIEHH